MSPTLPWPAPAPDPAPALTREWALLSAESLCPDVSQGDRLICTVVSWNAPNCSLRWHWYRVLGCSMSPCSLRDGDKGEEKVATMLGHSVELLKKRNEAPPVSAWTRSSASEERTKLPLQGWWWLAVSLSSKEIQRIFLNPDHYSSLLEQNDQHRSTPSGPQTQGKDSTRKAEPLKDTSCQSPNNRECLWWGMGSRQRNFSFLGSWNKSNI